MKNNSFKYVLKAMALFCLFSFPLGSVSFGQASVGGGDDPSFCSWDPAKMACVEVFTGQGYCATYPPNCDGPIVNP